MSQSTANVSQLLRGAKETGALSIRAAQVLNIPDLGAQIQEGLGVKPDDVQAAEVFLFTGLFDDSGSIRFGGNAQIVRDGHNLVLDALSGSKQAHGVLAHVRYLNGTVLYQYSPLAQAIRMDSKNYDPSGGTPLFDETVVTLGTVIAKTQEFEDAGVPVKGITLIVTDGADCYSHRQTAQSVKAIVDDMLRTEKHIIAAMGIDDGMTDFRAVFASMGIRDEWILTPGKTQSEIRKAFLMVSQSALRVSQTGNFSQAALGGFGNP